MRVSRTGYVSVEAAGLSLVPGETKELRITMDPRRALANAVAEVARAGERQEVRTLPVRGQASGNLETLIPGSGASGGTFGSFPVNGSRAQFNTYIVSGVNNLDPFRGAEAIGQGGAFAAPAILLPLDAIQEIQVQTNTGAEYRQRQHLHGPRGRAGRPDGPVSHDLDAPTIFLTTPLAARDRSFGITSLASPPAARFRAAAIFSARMRDSTSASA